MRTFITLGDATNVADRLESLCKLINSEAVISQDVWRVVGLSADLLPAPEISLR